MIKNFNFSFVLKNFVILIYILFFLFLNIPSITFFFRDPDQGAQLAKAMQILNGFHPFIDIKGNIYGPLVFYMSALGQMLSGGRLIGEVVIILLGYLGSYFIIFYLTEKMTGNFPVSLGLLTIALTMLPRFYKYYIVFGPAVFLLSLYHYFYHDSQNRGAVFLALSTGLTFLFRLDFGVYAILIAVLSIYIRDKSLGMPGIARQWFRYAAFVSGVIIPWILFVVLKSGSFRHLLELPLIIRGIGEGLSLPTPVFDLSQSFFSGYNNFSLLFWFFRILPLFVVFGLVLNWNSFKEQERKFILMTSFFSTLLFVQALHRTSVPHLLQSIPISFILIGWLAFTLTGRILKKKWLLIPTCIYLILLIPGWGGFLSNQKTFKNYDKALKNGLKNFNYFFFTHSSLRDEFRDNKYVKVADLVIRNVRKNEPVLFIPIESQMYYFSERFFKTSLGVLGPGRLHGKKDEEEFFKELIRSGTKVIVDRPFFYYDRIPERNPRFYYPHLMKKMYSEYQIVKKSGEFVILCRDDRFNLDLSKMKHKFRLEPVMKQYSGTGKDSVNIDSINTFTAGNFPDSISRRSVFFIKGRIRIDSVGGLKHSFFLGLEGVKNYIARVVSGVGTGKESGTFEVFSSLENVEPGRYRLIFYSGSGDKYHTQNLSISLNVI